MGCISDASCTYIAGNLVNSKWSALVPLVLILVQVLELYLGAKVGAARTKYNIPYPSLYAVPGTKASYSPAKKADADSAKRNSIISDEDAYRFNCIQRGAQNTVAEHMALFLALLLAGWFTFPLPTAAAGLVWVIGKLFYFEGYSKGVQTRVWGVVSYFGLLALWALAIASAHALYNGTAPY